MRALTNYLRLKDAYEDQRVSGWNDHRRLPPRTSMTLLSILADCRGPPAHPVNLALHVSRLWPSHLAQQHLPLHGRPAGLRWASLHLWHCEIPEHGEHHREPGAGGCLSALGSAHTAQQETAAICTENLLEMMCLNRSHPAVNGNRLLVQKQIINSKVCIYPRVLESRSCFKGSFYSFLLP